MTPQVVIRFLALLTLFSNILLMALAILFALRNLKILSGYWDKIEKLLNKLALKLAFLVSLAATSGSLFLSEIAHFEPCKFCWFQRIFMYPLVFILGVAIYKKLKDAWLYVLPLSIIGGFIAIYHYFLQVNPEALAPCSATGYALKEVRVTVRVRVRRISLVKILLRHNSVFNFN